MKTYEDQLTDVKDIMKRSPWLEVIECKSIIAEDEERVLVRSVGAMKMNNKWCFTLGHELWYDKEKYHKGIAQETRGRKQYIYMMNITGADESKLIENFMNPRVCNL